MASSKEYMIFIAEQLSALDGISFRPMMGEYILYYNGKIVGGIYDDRLLFKMSAAKNIFKTETLEIPYPNAKPMLLADDVDDSEYLSSLVLATFNALYTEKTKK